jgi:spore coat polysaccharide biosynthesis protein SpsF
MDANVVAIIQARTASSRLPGKVLAEIAGTAMLGHVVRRTRLATAVHEVIVATSTEEADDAIEAYCSLQDVVCFRGSHFDVLDRYHSAASLADADLVVRITADCPLIDPELVGQTIRLLAHGRAQAIDFAATRLPPPWHRTFPIGLDVEACTMDALERAWREASAPEEREHVMPFMYKGAELTRKSPRVSEGKSSSGMRIAILDCDEDLGAQRWTVDTAQDLEFVRAVYAAFNGRQDFSWLEARELLRAHPGLLEINGNVRHKTMGEVDTRADGGTAT